MSKQVITLIAVALVAVAVANKTTLTDKLPLIGKGK